MRTLLTVALLLILGGATSLCAQNLDRITLSSGGATTDEVSYVIGETFNFAIAGGDIILETGSQGSADDTGGDNNYTAIAQIAEAKQINCYPNPATSEISFSIKGVEDANLQVMIFDINGKLLQVSEIQRSTIITYDIKSFAAGSYILSVSNAEGEIYGVTKFVKQ